jgi:hypothetical protein
MFAGITETFDTRAPPCHGLPASALSRFSPSRSQMTLGGRIDLRAETQRGSIR